MRSVALGAVALGLALAAAAPAAARPRPIYLSLGDSLSMGVQPGPARDPGHQQAIVNTRQGFSEQLRDRMRRRFPGLRLVRGGCGGATTGSFRRGGPGVGGGPGCTPPRRTPYAGTSRATSQLAWAGRFLREHRRQVAFVTVDIGSNDLSECAPGGSVDPACVAAGRQSLQRDLPRIARRLRRAAGRYIPVVGATLYDPFLAYWRTGASGRQVAALSQTLANDINAQIVEPAYEHAGIGVARVGEALRSDVPLTRMTTAPGLGVVPVAVASICSNTWMCRPPPVGPNIHANADGYGLMAGAFARAVRAEVRRLKRP